MYLKEEISLACFVNKTQTMKVAKTNEFFTMEAKQ